MRILFRCKRCFKNRLLVFSQNKADERIDDRRQFINKETDQSCDQILPATSSGNDVLTKSGKILLCRNGKHHAVKFFMIKE